ncbi:hypothetical protein ACNKHK_18405 [Shigella flexneri]
MSEQHVQGADAVADLNNELKTRREKLASLREQAFRSRTISVAIIPQTNCMLTSTRKKTSGGSAEH